MNFIHQPGGDSGEFHYILQCKVSSLRVFMRSSSSEIVVSGRVHQVFVVASFGRQDGYWNLNTSASHCAATGVAHEIRCIVGISDWAKFARRTTGKSFRS